MRLEGGSGEGGGGGLTRKPRTGLPPGSLQTRGTARVAVISSQMVWISPSVPWGTSGRGSLLVSSLTSTGTCHHTHTERQKSCNGEEQLKQLPVVGP